jgi:hypothetical protein
MEDTMDVTRRSVMQGFIVVSSGVLSGNANAVEEENNTTSQQQTPQGLLTPYDVADLLNPIPTFTIVDDDGVPFMVVGEDAKVTGYFFTSYPEASRILQLAKTSADRAIAKAKADGEDPKEIGTNPWKGARISTIPLDSAVTLVSKSQRAVGKGIYFKVAPAEGDVEDALAVTGEEDLSEGKVPLFYYEDFTVLNEEGSAKTPLYFRKKELEKEWRRSNPRTTEPPKLMVTELFAVLAELVKPEGSDDDLRNLIIVAPTESEKKRQECLKKGGKAPAFVIGKRIIVL